MPTDKEWTALAKKALDDYVKANRSRTSEPDTTARKLAELRQMIGELKAGAAFDGPAVVLGDSKPEEGTRSAEEHARAYANRRPGRFDVSRSDPYQGEADRLARESARAYAERVNRKSSRSKS